MRLSRLPVIFALLAGTLAAQSTDATPPPLYGSIRGDTYISPTGAFTIAIPVLPELGGRVSDTQNVVTFDDDYSVHTSIAVFALDATQRWEKDTRGIQDYVIYFYRSFVLPDYQQQYAGTQVEGADFLPKIEGGALLTYLLIPGGSFFESRGTLPFAGAPQAPVVAKRGNLCFVKNGFIYVMSIELAERATERSLWKKTPAEEDAILEQRLLDLLNKIQFTPVSPDTSGN